MNSWICFLPFLLQDCTAEAKSSLTIISVFHSLGKNEAQLAFSDLLVSKYSQTLVFKQFIPKSCSITDLLKSKIFSIRNITWINPFLAPKRKTFVYLCSCISSIKMPINAM